MEKSECSFSKLPFSNLFSNYIYDYPKLNEFFTTNPFDDAEIQARCSSIPTYTNRDKVVAALSDYHQQLGISESQKGQLKKFSDPNSLVVVTGQQLGIYGGPLYTVYKTLTTILLAEKWEKKLQRPVIPVFWLADEDHDFAEIATLGIPGNDGKTDVNLNEMGKGIPVSEEYLSKEIEKVKSELKELLPETDFSQGLWSDLDSHYQQGKTHAGAFSALISSWFSQHGVLIAGSNHKRLKQLLKKVFKQSVEKANDIQQALETQSTHLERNYHRQVVVGDTNLFYLGEQGRSKFQRANDVWAVDSIKMTKSEIISRIEDSPEKFSPNVFLRPVIQDVLLPTIGYVAGPGELAYYAQMKTFYEQFEMEMPVIFPRISATLLESGIDRIMEKLPFDMCSYNQRIEDLEARYIELNSATDVDKIFRDWIKQISSISQNPINEIQEIDPTLKGAAGKLMSGFENDANKLKGRVYRSIKQQEETQLKRIARIQAQLFPDGLQERAVNPIYFMNKYGLDLWDNLLDNFRKQELDLTIHHIIKL